MRPPQESNPASSSLPPENLSRQFSLDEILAATNDFDDSLVIGQGGFAKVYKGEIDNLAHTVAIKRMKPMFKEGAPEFRTEILMVSKFRHSHLVSLIGYCESENEMIIVYEYMARGTLEDNLHKIGTRGNNNLPLCWVQRLKICIGAARGLEYLHTGTGIQHRVIHRDVKSSNILLDENWAAKISDFGMSKIGPANQSDTHVSTRVVGTFGYLDPEYAFTGSLTSKSDVYSFGVILFEVLCGRPALDRRLHEDQRGLARWAHYCVKKGIVKQIIDPNLKSQIVPRSLLAFVKVADRCLHARPKERPTMNEVLTDLELALNLQESAKVASGFAEKFRLLSSVTPRPISEIMVAPRTIQINFKYLLNAACEQLQLPSPIYRFHVEDYLFQAFVEIKPFPDTDESLEYWGSSNRIQRAESLACRAALLFLKIHYKIVIDDDNYNYEDLQYFKYYFEKSSTAYKKMLGEYCEVKKKLEEVKKELDNIYRNP